MLAVRAPEYFPRLDYVAAMLFADCFVLADTYQYVRQSYQNRMTMRNPDGWQWVTVPLKGGQHGLPHNAVRIRQVRSWRKRHWKAFAYNYRKAPYFEHYEDRLRAFFECPRALLGDLVIASVELMHDCLGLRAALVRASELPGCPTAAADILRALRPGTLLVTPETAALDAPLARNTMVLCFDHPTYRQTFDGFEPGMTTLDLLFNYGPETTEMLRRATRLVPYSEQSGTRLVSAADLKTDA